MFFLISSPTCFFVKDVSDVSAVVEAHDELPGLQLRQLLQNHLLCRLLHLQDPAGKMQVRFRCVRGQMQVSYRSNAGKMLVR